MDGLASAEGAARAQRLSAEGLDVALLESDESTCMTGSELVIDGGDTAR